MGRLTERTGEGQAIPKMNLRNNGHQRCMDRLAEYEDLEEQGLIVKLPCKIGDTIYKVPSNANYGLNIVNRHEENNRVYRQEVCRIEISSNGTFSLRTCNGLDGVVSVSFGETWFLKEDEAEAKLKELEELNKHLKQEEQILKDMEVAK